jgi:hypothetical protein
MRHAAFALLLAAGANADAACALQLLDPASGTRLARVPLGGEPSFALVYTHSVTLRPVESRYELRGGAIVQTAELFDEHGPGMSTEPLPGETLETLRDANGTRFVLKMARPLPTLVVRLHERPAFRLLAGGQAMALDPWRAPSIEIRPDCADETKAVR